MVAILDRAHSCGVHHSSIKFVFIITHLKSIVCATPWLCLQLAFFKILNEAVTLGITKKPYQITKKKNCKSGLDAYSGKVPYGTLEWSLAIMMGFRMMVQGYRWSSSALLYGAEERQV